MVAQSVTLYTGTLASNTESLVISRIVGKMLFKISHSHIREFEYMQQNTILMKSRPEMSNFLLCTGQLFSMFLWENFAVLTLDISLMLFGKIYWY